MSRTLPAAKQDYLKAVAEDGLRYGRLNRTVANHLAQDPETALDLAAKAIANPLYGVSQQAGFWNFQGQTYGTVKDLAQGLGNYLGYFVDEADVSDLLLADLADPRERRVAILGILKRQAPQMPEELTWTDQLSLQALLGDI